MFVWGEKSIDHSDEGEVLLLKMKKKDTETEPNNHLPVYVSVSNLLASFKQRTLVRALSLSL